MEEKRSEVRVELWGRPWSEDELRRVLAVARDALLESPEVRDALRGYLLDEGREPTEAAMLRALDEREVLLFVQAALPERSDA